MTRKRDSLTPHDFETIARLRVALRRFQAATDQATATYGLTPRQYDLLSVLHAPSRGGLGVASAIADEMCISPNAMTELVSRAEKAGLVQRGDDLKDARLKPITATPEGSRRFRAAARDLAPQREQLLALLREATTQAERLAHRQA